MAEGIPPDTKKAQETKTGETVKCPYCKEDVRLGSINIHDLLKCPSPNNPHRIKAPTVVSA